MSRLIPRALAQLVDFQVKAGVHGLWVLGTTARFDLLPDDSWRVAAETASHAADGRIPLVLNVSDQGTKRTQVRAALFDDLPYDYYAALPPWYQAMTPAEVADYFLELADTLARPLVIYNAPWVCNQLSFDQLRQLSRHPRIVGCKDVTPLLSRTLDWTPAERRAADFSYLHGTDQLATSTELGADGFVSSLTNVLPELAVAIWDATRADDAELRVPPAVSIPPHRPRHGVRPVPRLPRRDDAPSRFPELHAPEAFASAGRRHGSARRRRAGRGRRRAGLGGQCVSSSTQVARRRPNSYIQEECNAPLPCPIAD